MSQPPTRDLDVAGALIGGEHLLCQKAGVAERGAAVTGGIGGGILEGARHDGVVHHALGGRVELIVIRHRLAVGRIDAQRVVEVMEEIPAGVEAASGHRRLVVFLSPAVDGVTLNGAYSAGK